MSEYFKSKFLKRIFIKKLKFSDLKIKFFSSPETLQIPVIDCDLLARRVVEPGKPAYKKIVKYFGDSVLL